jgi:type VI secretion system protein ImpK
MRNDTTRFVYPVLAHGLDLRGRLARGQPAAFDRGHARLKELLLAGPADTSAAGPRPPILPSTPGGGSAAFLGSRYALVCWIDELFTHGSPWADRWNERKLEVELYGSNDRAWKFWEQAKLAEQQPGDDALETFFLCALLGFRGTLAEAPARFDEWIVAARERLRALPADETPYDLEPDPVPDVPPRRAARGFARMLAAAGVILLVLIPCAAFLVVAYAGRR